MDRRTFVLGSGALVAGCQSVTPASSFFRSPLAAGQNARSLVGGFADDFALSPDGSRVAIAGRIREDEPVGLVLLDWRTGVVARYDFREDAQAADRRYRLRAPAFSPDGQLIAVAAQRARPIPDFPRAPWPMGLDVSDIAVFPVEGGQARRYGDQTYYHAFPRFTPDGTRLGCMRSDEPLDFSRSLHVENFHNWYRYNGASAFYEFDVASGQGAAFAQTRFVVERAFFYAPDGEAVYYRGMPPLIGERGGGGLTGIRPDVPIRIWRIPRGAAAELGAPFIPDGGAGTVIGVRSSGAVLLQRGVPDPDSPRGPRQLYIPQMSEAAPDGSISLRPDIPFGDQMSLDGTTFVAKTIRDGGPREVEQGLRFFHAPTGETVELYLNDIYRSLQTVNVRV